MWAGLKTLGTKQFVDGLEFTLLTIAALLHRDDLVASKIQERIDELKPKAVGPSTGSALSSFNTEAVQKMFGGIMNGMVDMMR